MFRTGRRPVVRVDMNDHSTTSTTFTMVRHLAIFLIPFLLLATAGCESAASKATKAGLAAYRFGDFATARAKFTELAAKTDEDFVLNNCRLGSTALAVNDLDTAEAAFLRAYEVMNSVGVNNGGRTLGATLVDEKIKIWKGEPFERAMTNFYLGMTYYMRHDYDNARAAFENALFKLRDYGGDAKKTDQYREVESNFTLGLLMLAKCQQRLGRDDLAKANFQRVAELRPQLAALADFDWNAKSNLLLFIDYGYGPRKVTNNDGAIVGFGPSPYQAGPIPSPLVRVNGTNINLGGLPQPPVDLLRLAQERQWQSIDTIRVVKSAVGTGLIVGGAIEGTRKGGSPEVGLALAAAGLLLKATSQADVRQWEMLPRTVYILPLHVQPGTYDICVSFPTAGDVNQTWQGVPVPVNGEAAYYFHPQPYTNPVMVWPSTAQPAPAP